MPDTPRCNWRVEQAESGIALRAIAICVRARGTKVNQTTAQPICVFFRGSGIVKVTSEIRISLLVPRLILIFVRLVPRLHIE